MIHLALLTRYQSGTKQWTERRMDKWTSCDSLIVWRSAVKNDIFQCEFWLHISSIMTMVRGSA